MPYRRTENVVRKLAARHDAILAAARALAAERGMAAVQIVPVAERAGIAAGTVYRYFPAKTDLVTAVVANLAEGEVAALRQAAAAAPGPLSALAAVFATFAARALLRRPLAFGLLAEPVEPEIDAARAPYRRALLGELEAHILAAVDGGHLPDQDAALAARVLLGALIEGLIGLRAPALPGAGDGVRGQSGVHDQRASREQVQALTLLALRALGIRDARARGLVVQTALPASGLGP